MLASLSSLILLSFAVSLDGFGVGMTYGVRRIRIPLKSVIIISVCSGLVMLLAMLAGSMLAHWIPPRGASAVGAFILIGIGLWALAQLLRTGNANDEGADRANLIEILKSPSAADRDRSGTISPAEACLLGAALSLDAFGAGIGAAMIGFPPLLTAALITAASGSFLQLGTRVGCRAAGWRWVRQLSMLPGIILIAIGLLKLM